MGPFPGNERTWKPFNPILGETFELSMENGLKFIAEQVKIFLASKATLSMHWSYCCTLMCICAHSTNS